MREILLRRKWILSKVFLTFSFKLNNLVVSRFKFFINNNLDLIKLVF